MLKIILIIFTSLSFADNWAVLVAGSNTFENYRHQSDIFHAYHILNKNGFPADQIITMAYDDIAMDYQNPFPGKVFNEPKGPNVYIGSDRIDYRRKDVTAANFYAILEGDSEAVAGKKVLNSTKDDNVFIFIDDHGAP
ncbi:MAG: putative peptidase C13 family protein, partial [Streblomastix strix]